MPKPMYVWSGSAWVSVATEVESLATYATQSYADNQPGMKLVVPSSVTVGSGSGSVATQGTVTFTTASSVSLNNVFSSTYDNYFITTEITAVSTTLQVLYRLVDSSGTPNSTTNYYSANAESNVSAVTNRYSGAGASWNFSQGTITVGGLFYMNVNQPFGSTTTRGTHQLFTGGATATEWRSGAGSMVHNVASSFTGIQILTSTGTISGTIRVYGYKAG